MTRIEASAPGKLVLLGEYAVLDGAPALVLAVNRRVHARLMPSAGDAWEIVSPTLALHARLQLCNGVATWLDNAPPALVWIATLLSQFDDVEHLPPCRIELESDTFHLDHADKRVKLGLGSSAALTVALLGTLHALAGRAPPTLAQCIHAHRAIQHGHGSGIDVAASLSGGLLRFQLDGDAARADPQQLPARINWCCVFSGRPASTEALLGTVARWRQRAPDAYAQHARELATISARGVNAVATHDDAVFLSSLHDYANALARFGDAAGADIASREHRMLAAIARDCGCVYKSCGAGGGDVGITFAVEDTQLQAFAPRARAAGFALVELAAEPRGLLTATFN